MALRKALSLFLICAILCVSLAGCWDYRGLNEMALVMGMAIDRDEKTGEIVINCEIADLTRGNNSPLGSKMVEGRGRTLFEAVRNSKRRLLNKLYFGSMAVIVVSEKLAREVGVQSIVEWALRDAEFRETTNLLIAMGGEARSLLSIDGLDQTIVSIEINSIIAEDNKVTSSTVSTQLYQAYDDLDSPGISLTLPAFHVVKNDDKDVAEACGIAMFNGDKLVGFLTPEESRNLLYATNKAHGGIIILPSDGSGASDVSLEIEDSTGKIAFRAVDGRLVFSVDIKTTVYLSEVSQKMNVMNQEEVEALEARAEYMIAHGVLGLFTKVQSEYKTDVFGLGETVYRKDLGLWRKIEGSWPEMFPTVAIEVTCDVTIVNAAFTLTKGALTR